MKKVVAIVLTIITTAILTACGYSQAELDRAVNAAYAEGRTIGYSEGYQDARGKVYTDNNGRTYSTTQLVSTLDVTDTNTQHYEAQKLPILMTKDGYWLDQNGEEMTPIESSSFLGMHHEYAKVVAVINLLHEDIVTDYTQFKLERLLEDANSAKVNDEEYLSYQWFYNQVIDTYSECWNSYSQCFDDFCQNFIDQVDVDASRSAKTAANIVFSTTMLFQESGLYDEIVNSRKVSEPEPAIPTPTSTNATTSKEQPSGSATHGTPSATQTTSTPGTSSTPSSARTTSTPNTSSGATVTTGEEEPNWQTMSDEEVISYLDSHKITPPTDFDLAYPHLYFDRSGQVHGATSYEELCFYATSLGEVYRLDDGVTVDNSECNGKEADLLENATYVGRTNHRIK